jgi:cell division protein FtsW (lipid II flippase)
MRGKEEYLDGVCNEIRFKAARKYLRRELEEHIDDRARELSEKGMPDADAAAIAAMGDAKETGRALNAVHRPRTEWGVIICVILLSLAGIAAANIETGHTYYNYNQMLWSGLQSMLPVFLTFGLCLMVGLNFFDYTRLLRLRYVFFGVAFLLVASFIIYVSILPPLYSADYISRNIGEAVYNYYLSVVALTAPLFFMISASGYIQLSRGKAIKGAVSIAIYLALSVFALYMLIATMVLPSVARVYSLLLAAVYIFMMFINAHNGVQRKKWLHFAIASGTIIIVLGLCLFLAPYPYMAAVSGDRINYYSYSYSAQTMQEAFKGANAVGASPQFIEWRFLNTSQYMVTAFIVGYGWLPALAIVLAFIVLFVFMISRSLKIADPFGRLLASGIAALFLFRLALFVLASTGLVGGLSFVIPFVSCGSIFYIADAMLIGIFLSVWRRSTFMKKDNITTPAATG